MNSRLSTYAVCAIAALSVLSVSSVLAISVSQKMQSKKALIGKLRQLPGFIKYWDKSEGEVIKLIGTPDSKWRELDFDKSDPKNQGYKDHLVYRKASGSVYVDIPVFHGKPYNVEAVYAKLPKPSDLALLIGITDTVKITKDGDEWSFTSPMLGKLFPDEPGSKSKSKGRIMSIPNEMVSGNDPFEKNCRMNGAKAGYYYVVFPE